MKTIEERIRERITEFEPMKSVYCYHFPEVRPILREVSRAIPDDMYKVTASAGFIRENLDILFDPPLDVPATDKGHVNLDELHVPVINRIVETYSDVVPGLSVFENRYPTPGSSEGIFKLLAKAKTDGIDEINVLYGEYEGYKAYAGHLGMDVNEIDAEETDILSIEPGLWFISNPSARDGNVISNHTISALCDQGNKVVIDLAYVGMTDPRYTFDVSHENIEAAIMSLSKPYGLFRKRVGFIFTKEPVDSLYGNKWFKDDERLLQALKVVEDLPPGTLRFKYHLAQDMIIRGINEKYGLNMEPSDVFLLGYITDGDAATLESYKLDSIKKYKRGNGYRFCFTPYFERCEDLIQNMWKESDAGA